MKTIEEWTEEIVAYVTEKFPEWTGGWSTAPKALMYIVTECSEGMEAWRDDDHEAFAEELADIFIRLIDYADKFNVDLDAEVEKKMKKNWLRPVHHGRAQV